MSVRPTYLERLASQSAPCADPRGQMLHAAASTAPLSATRCRPGGPLHKRGLPGRLPL